MTLAQLTTSNPTSCKHLVLWNTPDILSPCSNPMNCIEIRLVKPAEILLPHHYNNMPNFLGLSPSPWLYKKVKESLLENFLLTLIHWKIEVHHLKIVSA
jgi:hypothetical protein